MFNDDYHTNILGYWHDLLKRINSQFFKWWALPHSAGFLVLVAAAATTAIAAVGRDRGVVGRGRPVVARHGGTLSLSRPQLATEDKV